MSGRARARPRCMCDFPVTCDGLGSVQCVGCDGETCCCGACFGHGERECDGCIECAGFRNDYAEQEEAA